MKDKCRRTVPALLLGLAMTTSAVAASPTPEIGQLLTAFRTEFAEGLRKGTIDALVLGAGEGLRLMPPDHGSVFGRENALGYYRAVLAHFEVRSFRRELGEIADFGAQVGEYGTFTQSLVHRETRRAYELAGKYVDLWTKASDGSLQLALQVWNYDARPASGESLRLPGVPGVRTALEAHLPVKGGVSFELAALNMLHGVAIAQRDGAVWAQFFADDAVLLPNFSALCRGRAAIDAYILAHAAGLPVYEHLDIRNDHIADLGAYVIEYASHVANWRAGDASGVNTGKNLRIWRRAPSGGLRLFWQIGNYD